MIRTLLLVALLSVFAITSAPLVAQDGAGTDADDAATTELAAVAEAYQAAREQRFAAGPGMDALEKIASAYIDKWTDKAPATVVASARTYRVRCLLTASKHAEILEETAALLAIDGLNEDDAYKLYYYRGMAAIQQDQKAIAAECVEKLTAIKPDIGAALKGAMAEKWPLVVVGEMAPQWTLPRVKYGAETGTEGELSLESLRGQYVLLDFWATWCGPCKGLMASELVHIHKEWAKDDRFELVSVGTNWRDDTAVMQADYAHEMDYHWTKVFDTTGSVAGDHGVRGIPTLTFIGPDGKVIIHGYAREVMPVVKETLAKLAAERAPGAEAEPETEPTPEAPELEEEDF